MTPAPHARAVFCMLAALSAARGAGAASLRERLAWQIALERVALSPGLVDGLPGPKTALATWEFQRVRGLPRTGQLDDATATALGVAPDQAVTTCTIQADDARQVGAAPTDWVARSKLERLAYPSLEELVAERFHCSRRLLGQLNPGTDLAQLKAGDTLRVPAIPADLAAPQGARIDINLAEKAIRVVSTDEKLVGLFHCSIAASKANLPSGKAAVAVVVEDPNYTFDPEKWPEVKGVDRTLIIPPGPRNPVGVRWIGLTLPGYGIHGTPWPELIGKTGSHGCIRLTNWDAVRLSRMIRVGTPVTFATTPTRPTSRPYNEKAP